MSGALLVWGATSGAGKSTVASALCRIWSDAGLADAVAGTDAVALGICAGYEIRWGRPVTGEPWDLAFEGSHRGSVHGTSVHGLFDDDAFRHSFVGEVARSRGRRYEPSPVPIHAAVDAHLDHLATWLGEHLDLDALDEIATSALPVSDTPGWV